MVPKNSTGQQPASASQNPTRSEGPPTAGNPDPKPRRSFCLPTQSADTFQHLDELGNLLRSAVDIFDAASDSFTSAQWGAFFLLRQSLVIVKEMEDDEVRPGKCGEELRGTRAEEQQ